MALPLRLKRSDYEHTRYFELIPPGTTLETAMSPQYWEHVRVGMRIYDEIELVAADGSFDALVRVVHIDSRSGALAFRVLNHVVGEGKTVSVAAVKESPVELKHRGHGKWAVLERGSGKLLLDGVSKDEALAFAEGSDKAA